jgi:hypothetical protein
MGPSTLDVGRNQSAKLDARFRRILAEVGENAIYLVHMNTELPYLGSLCVICRMRRGNQQAKHQCGQGRYQAHDQLYNVLGVTIQVVRRQSAAEEDTEKSATEGAAEYQRGDYGGTHR